MHTKTQTKIEDLFKDHALLIIEKDKTKSLSFKILLDAHQDEGIFCSCGYVPELSTETEECIYIPKDLNNPKMLRLPQPNEAKKQSIRTTLDAIRNAEKEYTAVDHFIKDLTGKSEVELFMFIEGFGGMLFTNRRAYNKGHMEMEEEAFNEMQLDLLKKQEACLPFLAPFGLEVNSETIKQPAKRAEYDRWYKFWKKWLDSFTPNAWDLVEKLLCNNDPSLEDYLPKERWNEN